MERLIARLLRGPILAAILRALGRRSRGTGGQAGPGGARSPAGRGRPGRGAPGGVDPGLGRRVRMIARMLRGLR